MKKMKKKNVFILSNGMFKKTRAQKMPVVAGHLVTNRLLLKQMVSQAVVCEIERFWDSA